MAINNGDLFRARCAPYLDVAYEGQNILFAALEKNRMPMTVTDPSALGNPIIFANQAFLDLTGYSASEVLGRNCKFLQGKDTDPSTIASIREAIAEEREISVELLNYRKDGSSFWNALFLSPVLDDNGKLIYYFGSQLNVSRRRDAEESLRQARKMEALGQLTGGIAHDFNNLLQVMSGYLDSISREAEHPDTNREKISNYAKHARSAAERAAMLTQQLLAYSRKQETSRRTLNLNSVLNAREAMTGTMFEGITFLLDLEPDLSNCEVDPTQLETSLLNLFVNAKDAMQGRPNPTLSVRTRNCVLNEQEALALGTFGAGRYVMLDVSDNGAGMPAALLSQVVMPFFTTKGEGKGTGLGLSMVFSFAKQSGGAAQITSEENIGTQLTLYFPAVDAQPTAFVQRDTNEWQGSERILIVEDREDVAHLAEMMLESEGYSTEVAFNAKEALAMLNFSPFDLLFTDLVMPGGMDGLALAREARKRFPAVKVLITTGYSDIASEGDEANTGEFAVLSKPYAMTDLSKKVRMVLNDANGVG